MGLFRHKGNCFTKKILRLSLYRPAPPTLSPNDRITMMHFKLVSWYFAVPKIAVLVILVLEFEYQYKDLQKVCHCDENTKNH